MGHFKITFEPDGRQISIHAGATLLEACGQAGIILNTVCGGKGTCRKCLVRVQGDAKEFLACQYRIEADLVVEVPHESRMFGHKILTHGITSRRDVPPDIYKKYQFADRTAGVYGVAVDVGTTTVVAKLMDMDSGQAVATQAVLNPQTRFGDDVISRITHGQSREGLAELHAVIIDCVNDLVYRLCADTAVTTEQIFEMCVVGNTTMNHIFLALPVEQLGQAPYRAYSIDAHDVSPAQLGLKMNPRGNVHTVENIAGFVGADTVAVALAVDVASAEQVTLVVDIGTNGEIVLGTKDRLYAASCAAGPALEGARITCGSRAADGAIESVVAANADIDVDVIGGCEARSICGSGLIDSVAVLLDLGVVDATGRFVGADHSAQLPGAIAKRLCQKHGQPAFVLTPESQHSSRDVFLTQKDIREVQLAKGAIRTGIRLLQKRLGLRDSDIQKVLLAGAFGNYIRRESAVRIGLLPGVPLERIEFVGNAASIGAQMALISDHCRRQCKELARKIQYVEIAHDPDFADVFADSMRLVA